LDLVPRSPNRLLTSLGEEDYEVVRPHLRPLKLIRGHVLTAAGAQLEQVYFPHSGVISLVVSLTGGETIEAGMIGRDSVYGAYAALDGGIALNDAIVQFPGTASILEVADLRAASERSVGFRTRLIRHEQAILVQSQQAGACIAFHTAECRLAGWLLRMRDLSGSDALPLTQEFLAQMIGVRRNAVSLVANALQRAGLIRYHRGRIEITNVAGLRRAACECYGAVRSQYERLLRDDANTA
jgi:CRP-like cAMP-binding protein